MPEPFLLLAQTAVSLPLSALRWELAQIVAGVILLFIAFAALAVFFFRRKSRDLTLVNFGLFCTLFALRLLARLQMIRSLFNHSEAFWDHVDWYITSPIIVPFGLFVYQLAGEYLRRFLRWIISIQAGFAVVGILGAVLGVRLSKLYTMNNVMILGTFVATAVFLFMTRASIHRPVAREIRIVVAGFLVWLAFILPTNLQGLMLRRGRNVEFLGFMVFVGCLGYVAAQRTFANEERLLAINKELEIARRMQSSTLPREVPSLPGLDIAARYLPMSAVAGDFYDFLVLDDNRIGILIADVTGHGVPAALIAAMLKVAFAAQLDHADDPARVLMGLNRALCGKFEEHFVTAAYVFVDVQKHVMRYGGAGHPPLMLASRSASSVRQIEQNGLMLGLFPEAAYSSTEIQIRAGDRCLLYTDGVLEAMNAAQEEFGKARLEQFLKTHSELLANEFTTAFLDEMSRWAGHATGRRQNDDITLLVLDFRNFPEAGR